MRGVRNSKLLTELLLFPTSLITTISPITSSPSSPSSPPLQSLSPSQFSRRDPCAAVIRRSCTAHYFCTHACVGMRSVNCAASGSGTNPVCTASRQRWMDGSSKKETGASAASGTPVAVSTEWARLGEVAGARVSKGDPPTIIIITIPFPTDIV